MNNSSIDSTAPRTKVHRQCSDSESSGDSGSPEISSGFQPNEVASSSAIAMETSSQGNGTQSESELSRQISEVLGLDEEAIDERNETVVDPPPCLAAIIQRRRNQMATTDSQSESNASNSSSMTSSLTQRESELVRQNLSTLSLKNGRKSGLSLAGSQLVNTFVSTRTRGLNFNTNFSPSTTNYALTFSFLDQAMNRVEEIGKVSFFPAEYPNRTIQEADKKTILSVIDSNKAAFENNVGGLGHHVTPIVFPTVTMRHGQLLVGCLNAFTRNFLIRTFTKYDWIADTLAMLFELCKRSKR